MVISFVKLINFNLNLNEKMVIFSGDQPHPSNTLRLTSGVMKRTLTKDQYELETYEQDELNNLYKQDKQALLLLR